MDTAHENCSGFVDTLTSLHGNEGKGLPMPDSIVQSVCCAFNLWLAQWKMKELSITKTPTLARCFQYYFSIISVF